MLVACSLKANPENSLFMTDTVEFLGFDVSRYGLNPAQAKIKAFLELRYPANVEECMCVMGKLRYYGCYCEHFSSMAEPLQYVRQVLDMLVMCSLKAHPENSLFMTDTVEFSVFDVSRHGLTPAWAKIKAFQELRYPANIKECMCVMGKLRYYGCFCEHFSSMAEPI